MTYTDVTNIRKRNPTDATVRNAKASKARDAKLAARLTLIERYLRLTDRGWRTKARG